MSYGESLKASEASSRQSAPSSAAQTSAGASSGGRLRNLSLQEARSRDGRTELELLQSTQKSLAEADQISTGMLGTLNEQTEQIERIQADSEAINQNLDSTGQMLKEMRPFGWLKNIFRPSPREKQAIGETQDKDGTSSSSRDAQPRSSQAAQPSKGAQRLLDAEAARRSSGGAQATKSVPGRPGGRDEQVEKAYDNIDNLLDGLKVKSQAINRTIDQHNQMLDPISNSIDRNQARVSQQQRELKKRLDGK